MRTLRQSLAIALVLSTAAPAGVFAQQRHAVDSAALAATVSDHAARQDTARAALRTALAQPEVRRLAAKTGIDLARMTAAVNTMSDADLEQAAVASRTINRVLVGGDARGVATGAVIIAALVGILIFVKGDYTDTCPRAECYK
jgi:hypothetical protein